MNAEQIKSIVALGEGFHAEFKVSVPSKVRELTEEICAFANASGGVLLIGVNDTNQIKGVSIDNAKRSSIQHSISEISPQLLCSFEIVNVEGLDVGVIEVPAGTNKPYVYSGSIFVRVGPNSQKLTTSEQMRDFFQQANKLYFDEAACNTFDTETQIDKDNFINFRAEAEFLPSVSDDQIRQNLQLFTADGNFKRGAVLFFGALPEAFYEQAIIRCVAFRGINKRFISDDKSYGGPLFIQYMSAMEWLRGKLNVAYDIEGQGGGPRKEVWEIPETVFKEAIINALSHRDYYEKGAVTTIELFDDRVEISNPGELLAAVGKDFGHKSISRNPLIFGLFQRMHLVEKVGSGILRMEELMLGNNLPAPIYQTEGMFTVIFKRPIATVVENSAETVEKTVEESMEKTILRLIRKNPFITTKEIEKETTLGRGSIEYHINNLKTKRVIDRVGPAKGGHWKIVSDTIKEKTMEETMEKSMEKTSEKILEYIEKNNSITISELAKMIGVTDRTIERQLYKLQKEDKIERIGSDKSGHWRTLPKTN